MIVYQKPPYQLIISKKNLMIKKKILITGGSRGIGYNISKFCLKLNYHVIITSTSIISKNKLHNMFSKKFIHNLSHYKLDQSNISSIHSFVNKIKKDHDKIDVLINNAGVNIREDFKNISPNSYDKILNTNLRGPFFVTQLLFDLIAKNKGGRIINISSVSGQYHGPFTAHYSISKASLISFTKFIARYGALKNVYCNAICPGLIKTDQTKTEFKTTAPDIINMTLLKREGTFSDVNSAVKFLLDENQTYLTGQTINVSGGAIL